jgi:hypothetical protein
MRSRTQRDKKGISILPGRQQHRIELDSTPRLVLRREQGQQGNHPCDKRPITADPDDRHDTHRIRGGRTIFGTTERPSQETTIEGGEMTNPNGEGNMQLEGAHHTRTRARRLSPTLRGQGRCPRIHRPCDERTSVAITNIGPRTS